MAPQQGTEESQKMRMRTAFQEEAASILRLKAGSEPGEELGWGKRFRKS